MLHRRDALLALGQVGLGALTLPGLLAGLRQTSAGPHPARPRAKSCIFIFLWGGRPHQDLWDLKPNAASAIRSPFRPIASAVPGIELCDQLPLLARQTDKMALVRSMTAWAREAMRAVMRTSLPVARPSVIWSRSARSSSVAGPVP